MTFDKSLFWKKKYSKGDLYFISDFDFQKDIPYREKKQQQDFLGKTALLEFSQKENIQIYVTNEDLDINFKKIDSETYLVDIKKFIGFYVSMKNKTTFDLAHAFFTNNLDIKNANFSYDDYSQILKSDAFQDFLKTLSEDDLVIIKKSLPQIENSGLSGATNVEILNELQNRNLDVLKFILDKLYEDKKVASIISSLSKVELENLCAAHNHEIYKTELANLKQLLELEKNNIVEDIRLHSNLNDYLAGQPEKIFQNWIERNLWVFGVEYVKKYDARQIALFSEGDLLMESMDGFLDLIELKRPKYEIFQYDASHKSYYASPDLSKTIGQCLLYLQKMDDYKLNLEKEHKVKILRPRIKIIAGRTNEFNETQFEALRMLNSNLIHIQIISYDYLLSCGEKIISSYEK